MNFLSLIVGVLVNYFLARFFYDFAGEIFEDLRAQHTQYIQYIAASLSIWYFGFQGIWKIRTQHEGVPEVFYRRITWLKFFEGFVWLPPKPFMSLQTVDMRKFKLSPPVTGAYSKDQVKIGADVYVWVHVDDAYNLLNLDGAMDLLLDIIDRTTRIVLGRHHILGIIEDGTLTSKGLATADEALSGELAAEIQKEIKLTEHILVTAHIRTIELDSKLEAATMQILIEEQERIAKLNEIEGVHERTKRLKGKIPYIEKLRAVQIEDGKRQGIAVDGSGTDFQQGAAIAGVVAATIKQEESAPTE